MGRSCSVIVRPRSNDRTLVLEKTYCPEVTLLLTAVTSPTNLLTKCSGCFLVNRSCRTSCHYFFVSCFSVGHVFPTSTMESESDHFSPYRADGKLHGFVSVVTGAHQPVGEADVTELAGKHAVFPSRFTPSTSHSTRRSIHLRPAPAPTILPLLCPNYSNGTPPVVSSHTPTPSPPSMTRSPSF